MKLNQSSGKIKVIHFQRRPRLGFNFSIENIFEDIRCRLKDKVDFSVEISGSYNNGYLSKFRNIVEAASRQKKNAIAHITGEIHFINLLMGKKNVLLTIHDCRFMERKKGIAKKMMRWLYLKAPVKKSAYIISVSESTKQDVVHYTGCNPEKVLVIPVNVNPVFKPSPKVFDKKCPIILQVGAAENKNLSRLAEALTGIPCQLVIIGDLLLKDNEKLKQHHIDYIVKTGLSTEELYQEYINCDIVSFISTFEGFGMPVIEANSVERAVITSNVSAMPEVAGDAACLVNPFDVGSIRNGFLKLIWNDVYREQLIANGMYNRKRFDGQAIADAYYELYKRMSTNL